VEKQGVQKKGMRKEGTGHATRGGTRRDVQRDNKKKEGSGIKGRTMIGGKESLERARKSDC